MTDTERFDLAIERLLSDQSPRAGIPDLSDDELAMLRMAQALRGSRRVSPRPEFVDDLHGRIFKRKRWVSRRTAFLSGIGAMAAGLLGGLGLDRAGLGASSPVSYSGNRPLVAANRGKWVHVANVADVPAGAVHPFDAGAIQGFIINNGGQIRAMSRICTHMGCALNFSQTEQHLVCPCHGAEFDMRGKMRYGAGGYTRELPRLPAIDVRVKGQKIEVFGV